MTGSKMSTQDQTDRGLQRQRSSLAEVGKTRWTWDCLLGTASSLSASEQLSLKSQEFKPTGVASQASARGCPLG